MSKTRVYLAVQAFQKLRTWTAMAKGEISWLGTVTEMTDERGKHAAFLIEDIHLLKQVCSRKGLMSLA